MPIAIERFNLTTSIPFALRASNMILHFGWYEQLVDRTKGVKVSKDRVISNYLVLITTLSRFQGFYSRRMKRRHN